MKKKNIHRLLIIASLVLVSSGTSAGLTPQDKEKTEKIRHAVEKGIISIYEISFDKLVNLEMWPELKFILEANNKNITKYTLPNMYYSRPCVVNNSIWVFGNTAGDGIYIFNPDTLEFIKKIYNEEYAKYDGGVRKIINNTVISGGPDKDVDTAVIWNTDTDDIKTVKLVEGHYIGSIETDDTRLYIGSCGGIINAWNFDTLEFSGNYFSSKEQNIDWNVFNKKECINGIKIIKDKLIGVGEKTVYIWDIETRKLLRSYAKALNNSIVSFYKNYMIEYKNNRVVVKNLEHTRITKKITVGKPVEDLIVTSEKVLKNYKGDLLILTLRYNKGILFYNFRTLQLIKKINTNGEALAVFRNTLFATDDSNIYKYHIINQDKEKYDEFLEKIDPNEINLTVDKYYELIKRLKQYPEIIKNSGIAEKFSELNQVTISHSYKYGKIGERFVFDNDDLAEENGYNEDVYGYKVLYEVRNNSENYYYITIESVWKGEFGKSSPYEDSHASSVSQSFFVPGRGFRRSQFEVGEKEPATLVMYPAKMQKVTRDYYNGFIKCLSKNNDDISFINRYLGDDLVKNWHDRLQERKNEITREKEEEFWLFKIFK
ncbi:MAG: hypothetical protein GY795_49320 [Desulfobacterales bacterium]|nr:hypothetical protein [Desulfobacterales bacterium]